MTSLAEIRQQYPQYDHVDDQTLADSLHQKFYAQVPKDDFYKALDYSPKPGLLEDLGTGIASTGEKIAGAALKGVAMLPGQEGAPGEVLNALGRGLQGEGNKNAPQRWTGQVGAVLPYIAAGPLGAEVAGATEGAATTQDLEEKGVDPDTAQRVGVPVGVLNSVAMHLPMGDVVTGAGSRALAGSIGKAAVKSAAVGAGQETASGAVGSEVLDEAGYQKLATDFAPTVDKAENAAESMMAFHGVGQGVHLGLDAIAQRSMKNLEDIADPNAKNNPPPDVPPTAGGPPPAPPADELPPGWSSLEVNQKQPQPTPPSFAATPDPQSNSFAVTDAEGKRVKGGFQTVNQAENEAERLAALQKPVEPAPEGSARAVVDEAAKIADTNPSDAQKESGNYRKGHIDVQGLPVTIETAKGTSRTGINPETGEAWATESPDHYGYVKGTNGADGEHIDAYVGPNPDSKMAFVVDQVDPATGEFDEHKAMLGYDNETQAVGAYRRGFSDGTGDERIGNVTPIPVSELKQWLKDGDGTKPIADQIPSSSPAPQAAPTPIESHARLLHTDKAVTPTGNTLPVQYALAEAGSLITSHDDTLRENPAYPEELQPRDRSRGDTELQLTRMLNPSKFQPEMLDKTVNSADGAPIVGEDSVTESGNGRIMALRRAYERDMPAAKMYRDYLAQQGYPVDGMKAPVLVRVNRAGMDPNQRASFAAESNKPSQLVMSSTERAMADAGKITDDLMTLAKPGDILQAQNRGFVRAMLKAIASDNELSTLVTPEGGLSQDGLRRVQGAILAKAYGDASIIQSLTEMTDNNFRAIGSALIEAAPMWSKMRAAVSSDAIPAELDITPHLLDAIKIISQARSEGRNVVEYVKQKDIFSGSAVAPETEAMLRWMLGGKDFTKRIGQAKIADTAQYYAQEALKVQPGPGLFGDADRVNPMNLAEAARAKVQPDESASQQDLLRPAVEQSAGAADIRNGDGQGGAKEQGRGPSETGQANAAVGTEGTKFQRPNQPTFYSALERGITDLPQGKASGEQWASTIKNLTSKGVKNEEIEWSGVQDWLKDQKGSITKDQVLDYIRANNLDVQEVVKGRTPEELKEYDKLYIERNGSMAGFPSEKEARFRELLNKESKFGVHTLPGGENYHELLMTLPPKVMSFDEYSDAYKKAAPGIDDATISERYPDYVQNPGTDISKENYKSSHFSEPNIVAHLRFNDRTDAAGKKVMFVEEVQSDWHQAGRKKGYNRQEQMDGLHRELAENVDKGSQIGKELDALYAKADSVRGDQKASQALDEQIEAKHNERVVQMMREDDIRHDLNVGFRSVPDAPFKTTWPELAFKRALRWAVENGHDSIAWTTGEQQADRYDLSHQVHELNIFNNGEGGWDVSARTKEGNRLKDVASGINKEKLADYVGKDLAARAINEQTEKGWKTYSGLDLKVGGKGMSEFYDKMLPNMVNKLTKKWGGKVTETEIPGVDQVDSPRIYQGDTPSFEDVKKVHDLSKERGDEHISPITGERMQYSLTRVAVENPLRKIVEGMRDGRGFHEMMKEKGTDELAKIFGGEMVKNPDAFKGAKVHSLEITPEMRESVMQGQPLFNKEAGASSHVPPEAVRIAPGLAAIPKSTFTAKEAELTRAVEKEVQRIMGGKATVQASEHLFSTGEHGAPGEVAGASNRVFSKDGVAHMIHWALTANDAVGVGRHESIHALREAGLIKPEEWDVLAKAADKGGWVGKHNVNGRWNDLRDHDARTEEAVAEEFSKWRRGESKVPEALRPVFARMRMLLQRIATAVRGLMGKDVTADDLFSKINTGEVGRRPLPQQSMDTVTRMAKAPSDDAPIEEKKDWYLKAPLESIEKAVGGFIDKKVPFLGKLGEGYTKVLAPDTVSKISELADARVATMKVRLQNALDVIAKQSRSEVLRWDKVPEEVQMDWIKNHETGHYDPRDPVHARFKALMDATFKAEHEAMNTDPTKNYRDNYFPHIFERPDKVKAWIEKMITKHGDDWFTKKRTFEIAEEAERAGFKLKTYNPEEMLQMRLMAGQDMINTQQLLEQLVKDGWAAKTKDMQRPSKTDPRQNEMGFIHAEKMSAGAVSDLLHNSFKVRGPDGKEWRIHNDIAPLWKNAMDSRGLWENQTAVGDIYRGIMAWRAFQIPLKLALSLFHPVHVATIHAGHAFAGAAEAIYTGAFDRKSGGDAMKSLTSALTQGFGLKTGIGIRGGKLQDHPYIQAVKTLPKDRTPEQQMIVNRYEKGGFTPLVSEKDTIHYKRQLINAMRNKELSFLPRAAQGLVRELSSPFFEHWIPALKAETYMRRTETALHNDPSLNDNDAACAVTFRQIGKDIDHTYGEMNYDTKFWNKTVRDAFQASYLSAGWKLAQLYYARGLLRVPKMMYTAIKNGEINPGKLTYNSTFALTYCGLSMVAARLFMAGMGAAYTGVRDLVAPPTGDTTPDGEPVRASLPFFNKEFYAAKSAIDQHGLINGLASFIYEQSMIPDYAGLITGTDRYGRDLVSDWGSRAQVAHAAWSTLSPISTDLSDRAAMKKSEVLKLAAFMGVSPAPNYMNQSTFENKVTGEYFKDFPTKGGAYERDVRTDYRIGLARMTDAKDKLEVAQSAGDKAAERKYNDALESMGYDKTLDETEAMVKAEGRLKKLGISDKEIDRMGDDYTTPFSQFAFKKLPAEAQIRLFKSANDKEKEVFYDLLKPEAQDEVDYQPKEIR